MQRLIAHNASHLKTIETWGQGSFVDGKTLEMCGIKDIDEEKFVGLIAQTAG